MTPPSGLGFQGTACCSVWSLQIKNILKVSTKKIIHLSPATVQADACVCVCVVCQQCHAITTVHYQNTK